MKIQHHLNKTADEISLSGSNLTINGKVYDLSAVKALPKIGGTEEEPVYETCENQRVYLSGEDVVILLKVDFEIFSFMFVNYNLKRFYDINENDIIDLNELQLIIDHLNMDETARREARAVIYQAYIKNLLSGEFKEICFDNGELGKLSKVKRKLFNTELLEAKTEWKKKGVPVKPAA